MKHLIAPSFRGGRNRWLGLLCLHRLPKPWKPISDPVRWSKWAGQGTFFFSRNGSLACNIIRNTLGHHLIFLQCDHMRKFVLMRGAQVWLVTLSVSEGVALSLPALGLLYCSQSHHTRPRFMLNKLELCFRDKPGNVLLWDMQTCGMHITLVWMGVFLACEFQLIESMQREQDGVHWPFLFFWVSLFFLRRCVDRVMCALTYVLQLCKLLLSI